MRQFALRHSCSEGCLVYFAVAPLVCTTIRGKGGAGETAFLANITVNLQSYVGTKRLCQGAQEGVMLPAHITRSPSQLQAQKQMVHHTLNVRLCFISPPPPPEHHASVAAPAPERPERGDHRLQDQIPERIPEERSERDHWRHSAFQAHQR